jgi:chorismate synthase
MNTYGKMFRLTTWGESHGPAIGCVIDGCPSKIKLTENDIQKDLDRRKPGQSSVTTQRKELDRVHILSGMFEGKTTGTPISLVIYNEDQRSKNYDNIKNVFRPGHADYTYQAKYGIRDYRGGGRASGRETACRVAAGAVAKKILEPSKIKFIAYTKQVGNVQAEKINFNEIEKNSVRCPDARAAQKMIKLVENVKKENDSIGGIVELIIKNVPAGMGEPLFNKLNAELSMALMSIGAIKGIEFGSGFDVATKRGSENNDLITMRANRVKFETNNAGGILGGISNGEDIVVRIAVKPTSSIGKKQKTINKAGNKSNIVIDGRHDPCLCPRIVPVVEAMAAIVLVNFYLVNKAYEK